MTLQPLLPWWLLAAVCAALLAVTVRQAITAGGRPRTERDGPAARKVRLRWLRRTGLVVVVLAIGLGPATAHTNTDEQTASVDMFFVVDRTGSMAAEDYDGNKPRLTGAMADIRSLVADIPGARYAVISFDSSASRQLPLTTDARAVDSWTQTMHQEITRYSHGSLTDRPYADLQDALKSAQKARPANTRLVFFLSDGEQTADGTPRSFSDLAPLIDGGAVLGYGTAKGGKMKEYGPNIDPKNATYIKDTTAALNADGEYPDAISKLDPKTLQTLAKQLGVPFAERNVPGPTKSLVAKVDPTLNASDGRRETRTYQVTVWPLAIILAVLLGFEAWGWASITGRRSAGETTTGRKVARL